MKKLSVKPWSAFQIVVHWMQYLLDMTRNYLEKEQETELTRVGKPFHISSRSYSQGFYRNRTGGIVLGKKTAQNIKWAETSNDLHLLVQQDPRWMRGGKRRTSSCKRAKGSRCIQLDVIRRSGYCMFFQANKHKYFTFLMHKNSQQKKKSVLAEIESKNH